MHAQTIPLSDDGHARLHTFLIESNDGFAHSPRISEPRPPILIFPGGGYMFCSRREWEPVALAFAMQGFQPFVLEYHRADESAYPAPIMDAERALTWIAEHAAEFEVNPHKSVVMGVSAGGHLAHVVGSSHPLEEFRAKARSYEGGQAIDPDAFTIAAIVTGYPAVNLKKLVEENEPGGQPRFEAGAMFTQYVAEADPMELIGPNTPPTFIFTTCQDEVLPAALTVEYVARLMAAGHEPEFHLFNEGLHGASTVDSWSDPSGMFPRRLGAWIGLASNWLRTTVG